MSATRSRLLVCFVLGCWAASTLVSPAAAIADQPTPPETPPVLLKMIRDDAVHAELGLSDRQIEQIRTSVEAIDGPWFRVRIRPESERVAVISKLAAQLGAQLETVLTQDQLTRLDQLQNQALGTRMVVREKAAKDLGVSASQRESLYALFRKTDQRAAEIQAELQKGNLTPAEAASDTRESKNNEQKEFLSTLTDEQKRRLVDVTGKSFDFSKVKRAYPLAPELTDQGATWLQGQKMNLDDLKGKVVAVHFYAFQCINCRRNLPHYNGWHRDYADQGLVVIGIQTPETSAERSPQRVTQAISEEKIQYPVLMDAESQNWKQWSNTMWPTVYLIDKKGFLRRWWQGEMNWKGIEGEQQMRETIEMLLAEES